MKTWNRERKRTRDRLLEYDFSIMPAVPHTAGLPYIYPWEDLQLDQIGRQMYEIACRNGFSESEDVFFARFGKGQVVTGTLLTFPIPGDFKTLYLDLETSILYYYMETNSNINQEQCDIIGAMIVEKENSTSKIYVPVRAMPLENLIIDCGDASEYID